jgi:hypothetical protein
MSSHGRGGLVPFGRGDLRAMLIELAHNAVRQRDSPLHAWDWKLCLRKSNKNVAVAAVARKLTVSIWYLLHGSLTPLKELDASLQVTQGRLATSIAVKAIRELGYESKTAFIKSKKNRTGY